MYLQDDECDKKVEDFTSDNILVDPDDPVRTLLQLIYPQTNHTEGIVESPERPTLLWGSQAAEQERQTDKMRLMIAACVENWLCFLHLIVR